MSLYDFVSKETEASPAHLATPSGAMHRLLQIESLARRAYYEDLAMLHPGDLRVCIQRSTVLINTTIHRYIHLCAPIHQYDVSTTYMVVRFPANVWTKRFLYSFLHLIILGFHHNDKNSTQQRSNAQRLGLSTE